MFCKIFFYSNPDPKSASWKKHEVFWLDHGYGGFNHGMPSRIWAVHCPKSNPNFRDISRNVEENKIPVLHEMFRVVSVFPAILYFMTYLGKLYTLGTVYHSQSIRSMTSLMHLYCIPSW